MSKVSKYLKRNNKPENRYWCFDKIINILDPGYSVISGSFICPICGELNYREDWDSVEEYYPRCLSCRNIVVEGEEIYDD